MSSMIFRRRDFDPDTGSEISAPAGAPFCKTGQRRLYFTSKGLEFRQPVNDTNSGGSPVNPTPSAPIRILDMGLGNTANGDRAAVLGGTNNHADEDNSVVLGGNGITADVENAAFAQRLHVQDYILLPSYADDTQRDNSFGVSPNVSPVAGMLIFVGSEMQVFDGDDWRVVELGSTSP